jgi:hypothetical protein
VTTSLRRGARRALRGCVLVAVNVVLVATASAALADGGTLDGLPGPAVPSGAVVTQVDRCSLYASTRGFGADCAGGHTAGDLKKVLKGQDFPECRYELLTPANDDGVPYDPKAHPDGTGRWYVVTCLKGIKPDGTGDFTRVISVQWFPNNNPPPTLTPEQNEAWNFIRSAYPPPKVAFGPASLPRVLIPTYYWLGQGSGDEITKTVFDGVRDVTMRARVDGIVVTSGAKDAPTLRCPGAGLPYDHSVGIYLQTSSCHDQYDRSSAIMPHDLYVGTITANWVVEFQRGDGSWQRLGMFPQSDDFKTAVQEIQTVAE